MDLLNKKLTSYVERKEKIVFDVRMNKKICELTSISVSLFLAIIVSGGIMLSLVSAINNPLWFFGIGIFSFVCFLILFFWLILLSNQSLRYVITERGIYKIGGMFFKKVKFVAYNKITDLTMCSGPVERLYNCGSVGIGTASGGNINVETGKQSNEIDIKSVDDYKKMKDFIARKIK